MAVKMKLFAASAASALGLAFLSPSGASADALSQPTMGATLAGNPNPVNFDAGPLGKVYVSGVVSGLGMVQSEHSPFDRSNLADLANGQVFIQTTSGPIQFFIDAGVYSLPVLGAPYVHASTLTGETFSGLPMAYVKIQPTSTLSIQAGKLPTLIGAEAAYTFQNLNIERGLLWNQEPVFSDGVQVNYNKGKVALSISLNDGFYSNRYNWLSGSFGYTFSPKDSLVISGGAPFSKYDRQSTTTPLLQNNSGILTVIYTHSEGPWVIMPYFQYTHVPSVRDAFGDRFAGTDSYGGALLAKYSVNPHWSLAGRVEYIASSSAVCPPGDEGCSQSSVLYGPGSKAVSVTLTPAFQQGVFFARGEVSYVKASGATPGLAFGNAGDATSQWRGLLETGFIF